MSHFDITPRSLSLSPQIAMFSPDTTVDERDDKSFVRGLVFGLVLAVTFWTVVIMALLFR